MRVHVASKDVLTVAGLRQLLQPCSFISVIGTSADEATTLSALEVEIPDVLVLGVSSEREVHAIVRAVRGVYAALKIVVLTDEPLAAQLVAAHHPRLEGVLIRGGDSLQDIGAVLRIVHQGGRVTSTYEETGRGAGPYPTTPELAARLRSLSDREAIVLRELVKGRTNAEIARPLHVSVATIKADLARIMSTMEAFSRVDLAVLAVQSGFLDRSPQAPPGVTPDAPARLSGSGGPA